MQLRKEIGPLFLNLDSIEENSITLKGLVFSDNCNKHIRILPHKMGIMMLLVRKYTTSEVDVLLTKIGCELLKPILALASFLC